MTLGERLRTRRKELGYSQYDLADLSGVPQISISRYELNVNMPTSEAIIKLAKALGVTSDWLLGLAEAEIEYDGLTDIERQALAFFRAKSPDRQPVVLEILRLLA